MTQLDPLLPEAQVDPDSRPAVDWSTDPWDATDRTGSVERLRTDRRVVKWIVWASMAVAIVAILIAGAVGWWYLGKINPAGAAGDVAELHGQRTGRHRVGRAAPRRRRTHLRSRDLRVVRRARRRPRADPGLLRAAAQRPHGQRPRTPAHAAGPDLHQGHVPRGLHPGSRWQSGSTPRCRRLTADGLHGGGRRRHDPIVVPAGRRHSLEGLLFPDTYQVSNAESEGQVIERMIALMERVGDQEDIVNQSACQRGHPVRDADHRVDDRARGQGPGGPGQDRPGHLQPARPERARPREPDPAADRRHGALRPGPAGIDPELPFT